MTNFKKNIMKFGMKLTMLLKLFDSEPVYNESKY